MSVPAHIDISAPWKAIEDSGRSQLFSAQLETELPETHILHGLKVNAVAARIDRDDVLFEVAGSETPLAVVHLTWRKKKETDPRWPSAKLFRSWDHWVEEDMQPAHEEYAH
jgi:hypothetical protein